MALEQITQLSIVLWWKLFIDRRRIRRHLTIHVDSWSRRISSEIWSWRSWRLGISTATAYIQSKRIGCARRLRYHLIGRAVISWTLTCTCRGTMMAVRTWCLRRLIFNGEIEYDFIAFQLFWKSFVTYIEIWIRLRAFGGGPRELVVRWRSRRQRKLIVWRLRCL